VHVDEVTLAGRPPLRLHLHERLTIVVGCPAEDRAEICAALPPAFLGFDVASLVRWVDASGTLRLVTTTDAIVPKLTVIGPSHIDGTPDRVLDLLTLARVPPTAMAPGLAVLDEPFVDCTAKQTWELLDLIQRVSGKVQTMMLSDDECVRAWAELHEDWLGLIDLQAAITS
jgi:hypothetical protein